MRATLASMRNPRLMPRQSCSSWLGRATPIAKRRPRRARLPRRRRLPTLRLARWCGDADIEAGIEDVEVEVEQEQEEIDQENEAEQYAVADAYATSGYVQVDIFDDPSGGIGVDASSEASAEGALGQWADQNNDNSQDAATTLAFNASPSFNNVEVIAGDLPRPSEMPARLVATPRSKQALRMLRSRSIRSRRRSIRRTMLIRTVRATPRRMRTMLTSI